jgi:tRNA (guanine37-N1)-methyltransferase
MTWRATVLTLFPAMFPGPLGLSLAGRALERGQWQLDIRDIREAATDRHRTVDDTPFGGGPGMVMRPEPLFDAVDAVRPPRPLLLLSASGRRFDQAMARELATGDGFSLLCGRYEGVDQRVADHLVDGELSVGDVVLSGGEAAACVVVDAVTRLLPGAMGNAESPVTESFGVNGLLEEPQYTRPASFRGWSVPDVLLSGNHGVIARWRAAQVLHRTLRMRPDLVEQRGGLRPDEVALLEEFPAVPYP